jgi:hypothetical protein
MRWSWRNSRVGPAFENAGHPRNGGPDSPGRGPRVRVDLGYNVTQLGAPSLQRHPTRGTLVTTSPNSGHPRYNVTQLGAPSLQRHPTRGTLATTSPNSGCPRSFRPGRGHIGDRSLAARFGQLVLRRASAGWPRRSWSAKRTLLGSGIRRHLTRGVPGRFDLGFRHGLIYGLLVCSTGRASRTRSLMCWKMARVAVERFNV